MSAARFPSALALVLSYEGGFSADPQDPGGPTNLGVTLQTLSDWRGHTCSAGDVRALCRRDVEPLYRARYWDAVHGDELPAGVDLMVFDAAVNQGPSAAVRVLQRAVGTTVDGQLGPVTLAAVGRAKAATIIEAIRLGRLGAYEASPSFARFGTGWRRRLAAMSATAAAWARKAET